MLTEIYIEALLVDEKMAESVLTINCRRLIRGLPLGKPRSFRK